MKTLILLALAFQSSPGVIMDTVWNSCNNLDNLSEWREVVYIHKEGGKQIFQLHFGPDYQFSWFVTDDTDGRQTHISHDSERNLVTKPHVVNPENGFRVIQHGNYSLIIRAIEQQQPFCLAYRVIFKMDNPTFL